MSATSSANRSYAAEASCQAVTLGETSPSASRLNFTTLSRGFTR